MKQYGGGSGGGGVYPIFVDRGVSNTIPSYDDMVYAITAGALVFLVVKSRQGNSYVTYVMSEFTPSDGEALFTKMNPAGGNLDEVIIGPDGTCGFSGYTITVSQPK